ncbi:conjugative transposon protein TraM [Catalinimonas niigatensis]|uniref:conjugative transposon protein TraM n=1 Tax=Catalinimonas niigatensis TaxID=1397264 RepID=UPI002665AACF|nr:conjugative transposon protein TraM [Catalinimonas niigatensis]WPP51844.1 conjugative transposon protein TraM [Catalinimonas niigatensis]
MDFKDNIDEEHINSEKLRFEAPVATKSWKDKVLKNLSRYSLLLIVGAAAIAITVLHFKGKGLLQALAFTPLPSFGWEEGIHPERIPDKTKVYEDALKKEAKERRREVTNKSSALAKLKVTKPDWQKVHQRSVSEKEEVKGDSIFIVADTLKTVVVQTAPQHEINTKSTVNLKQRKTQVPKKEAVVVQQENETKSTDFFQPVRVVSSSFAQSFTSCVVHGDQQLSNNSMLSLRLAEDLSFDGQSFPAGTILYGTARIAQNRIMVSVSRILQTPVQLQVHHHTFHEGILLDESDNVLEDATRQTVYRQGQRSVQDLPLDVATELGRNILQSSRRKKTTVFLPDGFPLYLSKQEN